MEYFKEYRKKRIRALQIFSPEDYHDVTFTLSGLTFSVVLARGGGVLSFHFQPGDYLVEDDNLLKFKIYPRQYFEANFEPIL